MILKALRLHMGNNEDVFVPESVSTEQLLEYHRTRIEAIQITEEDLLKVWQYPDQFHKLQDKLRQEGCITNGVLQMRFHALLRERLEEVRDLELEMAHKALAWQLERDQQRAEQDMIYLRAMEAQLEQVQPFSQQHERQLQKQRMEKQSVGGAKSGSTKDIAHIHTQAQTQVSAHFSSRSEPERPRQTNPHTNIHEIQSIDDIYMNSSEELNEKENIGNASANAMLSKPLQHVKEEGTNSDTDSTSSTTSDFSQ
jgi:hypothetical protein